MSNISTVEMSTMPTNDTKGITASFLANVIRDFLELHPRRYLADGTVAHAPIWAGHTCFSSLLSDCGIENLSNAFAAPQYSHARAGCATA
jgi:hypothetical protein